MGNPSVRCHFYLLYILNFGVRFHLKKGVCYDFFKWLFWFTLLLNVVGALGLVSRPLSTITRLLLPAPKGQQGSRTLEGKRVCSELSSFRLQSRFRVMIVWSGPLCLLTHDTHHLKAGSFWTQLVHSQKSAERRWWLCVSLLRSCEWQLEREWLKLS